MAEMLGLDYGKRTKSVSAPYSFPFIPSKFESSSYGRSLKCIQNVELCPHCSYTILWLVYIQTDFIRRFRFSFETRRHMRKIKFYIFLTLAVGGSEYSDSHPGCLTPVESVTGSHCVGGWVGPTAGVDTLMPIKIFFSCRQSNACPLITLHNIINLFALFLS